MGVRTSLNAPRREVDKQLNTSYDIVKIVADAIVEVILVGNSIADINTAAADMANVNIVAADIVNVNIAATDIANIILVAASITNVNTVGTNIADISTVATDIGNGNITAAIAAAISTAADLVLTNADVVLTNADVASTNADVVITNADVVLTNSDAADTAADLTNTNLNVNYSEEWANKAEDSLISAAAGGDTVDDYSALHHANKSITSATAAAVSAAAALVSEDAAAASYDSFDDRYLGSKTSNPSLDNDNNALLTGALYWNSTSNNLRVYTGTIWSIIPTSTNNDSATIAPTVNNDNTENYGIGSYWTGSVLNEYYVCLDVSTGAAIWEKLTNTIENANITARNIPLTKDILSQAGSSVAGFSAVLSTADDGITGTQYLRWQKDRNNIQGWYHSDSVRGNFYLASNSTAAEVATVPAINTDDVSFQWDLTKTKTGTTNRNKAYTAHYNPDMNVSVVGYVGDGVDGHEIPHHLPVTPELTMFFNRDSVIGNIVKSTLFGSDEYLFLNTTGALSVGATTDVLFSPTTIQVDSYSGINNSTDNIVMYNFASKEGVCKIGKYIGTGAAGNIIDCGFRVGWILVKDLDTNSWQIQDAMRAGYILPDATDAEASGSHDLDFDDNGFYTVDGGVGVNQLNHEYLFMAIVETSIDANKAVGNYVLPTNADELTVANPSLLTYANGFNANGEVNIQEQIAGATLTFGAGHENKKYYIYKDESGAWGNSEVRPLWGLTRPLADKSGVVSLTDALALHANSRTTAKHFDYESETGVALASGENSTDYAYKAFNKDSNDIVGSSFWQIASITDSWLQYKHAEKRILKSWRMREVDAAGKEPQRFTIEGSNNGLNWTAIDSTYTASNYTGNGASLWGDLQDITANTTAYLYHRIIITLNGADGTYTAIAEMELNTIIEGDYYLIDEAKMYNNAGTRLDRVYVGEMITDAGGDVVSFTNYAAGKQYLNELDVQGKAVFHGDVLGKMFATAWVNFDGKKTPPLILNSFNVKDVVDLGVGNFKIIFNESMDNISYLPIGSANQGGITVSITAAEDEMLTVNDFEVHVDNTAGAKVDPAICNYVIFGGKEIK